MTVAEIKPDALNDGQTLEGAPPAPADPGNTKPDGWDEKHGDTAVKEAQPEPKKPEEAVTPPEEKKPAEEPEKVTGPLKEYVSLDHPAGQAAIDVLKESGVNPNEAQAFFAEAIKTSDLSKVDWAALETKLGTAKAFLVRTGVESYYKDLQTKADTTVKEVTSIFGNEDNWNTVKTWAQSKEKADPAFATRLGDIREMLNKHGVHAEAGARELLRLYNSDPATSGKDNGKTLVVGDNTGTVIGTPLTRADYVTELKRAEARRASPTEMNTLHARRRAGMKQGL